MTSDITKLLQALEEFEKEQKQAQSEDEQEDFESYQKTSPFCHETDSFTIEQK